MKFIHPLEILCVVRSPSIRREWIEMSCISGGDLRCGSPSIRREWIEIVHPKQVTQLRKVSLHTEGVD